MPRLPHLVERYGHVARVKLVVTLIAGGRGGCAGAWRAVLKLLAHELARLLQLDVAVAVVVHLLVQALDGRVAQSVLVLLRAQTERTRTFWPFQRTRKCRQL